jgi:hypothetical protein
VPPESLEHLQRCPCALSLNLPFEGFFGGEDFGPGRAGKMRAQSVPGRNVGRGRPVELHLLLSAEVLPFPGAGRVLSRCHRTSLVRYQILKFRGVSCDPDTARPGSGRGEPRHLDCLVPPSVTAPLSLTKNTSPQ